MILIVPGVVAVLLVTALALAVRSRGLARAYWVGCVLLIGTGSILAAGALFFPPEEFDEAGNLIAEMPAGFGLSLLLAGLGMAAVLAGLVILWFRHIVHHRRTDGPFTDR